MFSVILLTDGTIDFCGFSLKSIVGLFCVFVGVCKMTSFATASVWNFLVWL